MFNLKKVVYKNILQVDDAVIPDGKTTCIIGESGSGKSTLLKLLNGMIDYTEGSITYHGDELKSLDPVQLRRRVILLPQTPVIFPGTVKENLIIGLHFSKKPVPGDKELADELKLVGLQLNLDDDSEPLSGGEKQRLALARVMLMKPEALLLDEPTSALDELSSEKVIDRVLKYINEGQNALVMVSHSKELARKIANLLITVSKGTIADIEEVA